MCLAYHGFQTAIQQRDEERYQTQYGGQPRQAPKLKRHFDPLGAAMSEVFVRMCKRCHLKPMDPTPPPNPLPKHWDTLPFPREARP